MLIAIMGLLASIAMILLGVAVIGRRGELATQHSAERVREVEANVGAEADEQSAGVGVEVSFFQGVRRGFAFYGEKSTADILAMARAGRWSEAWPWVMVALGLQLIFLWAPLLVGLLAGWRGLGLWAFVGLFFFGSLFAAFPRR